MKFFSKLTDILSHAAGIAGHVVDLANKGIAVDQTILSKAVAFVAFAEKFIPAQQGAPTTTLLPVPAEHADALGAKAA